MNKLVTEKTKKVVPIIKKKKEKNDVKDYQYGSHRKNIENAIGYLPPFPDLINVYDDNLNAAMNQVTLFVRN